MKIESQCLPASLNCQPVQPDFPASMESTDRVAYAAGWLADNLADSYALKSAPTSPLPGLTSNSAPGESPLNWLRGRNKCNQFAGDSLTWAGYEMPLYRMPDGSFHYRNAEALPKAKQHFDSLSSTDNIRPGDLLVLDWKTRGENGAHVEVITDFSTAQNRLSTLGAHPAGVEERSYTDLFRGDSIAGPFPHWEASSRSRGGYDVYVLRPLKELRE